jgi:hypothetical protein
MGAVGPDVDADGPADDTPPVPGPAVCGDGVLSPDEACEAFDLRGLRCVDLGFESGRLTCAADCTLETALCVRCGDGIRQGDELCDGAVDAAVSCALLRGPGATGTVVCGDDCQSLDDSGCSDPPLDGPFQPCDPASPSCPGGEVCARTAAGAACVEPCTATTSCGEDRWCAPLAGEVSTCLPRPGRGEACREGTPCAGDLTCIAAFGAEAPGLCGVLCEAGCGTDEVCTAVPSGAVARSGEAACAPGDVAACPAGFTCTFLEDTSGFRCVRPVQLCTFPQALYGLTSAGPADAQICDLAGPTGGGRFCRG